MGTLHDLDTWREKKLGNKDKEDDTKKREDKVNASLQRVDTLLAQMKENVANHKREEQERAAANVHVKNTYGLTSKKGSNQQ